MQYSPTSGCFYPDEIAYPEGAIPADAISVPTNIATAAMARAPGDTLSVSNGALVITKAAGPTLAEAQAAQVASLNQAYQNAIAAPVTFTTAAGTTAKFAQDSASKTNLTQYITSGQSAWQLSLWLDANGQPVSPFIFADLQGLAAAMEAADAPDFQELLALIAQVTAATTIAQVQAITWPGAVSA